MMCYLRFANTSSLNNSRGLCLSHGGHAVCCFLTVCCYLLVLQPPQCCPTDVHLHNGARAYLRGGGGGGLEGGMPPSHSGHNLSPGNIHVTLVIYYYCFIDTFSDHEGNTSKTMMSKRSSQY